MDQIEALSEIYMMRWVPASRYSTKWAIMTKQAKIHKQLQKKINIFFLDFSIDPGGSGGHPGGSRTDSGAEKV